jgi:hypothetical protein
MTLNKFNEINRFNVFFLESRARLGECVINAGGLHSLRGVLYSPGENLLNPLKKLKLLRVSLLPSDSSKASTVKSASLNTPITSSVGKRVDLARRVETLVKTSKRRQNAEPACSAPSRLVLDANNALRRSTSLRTRSVARDLAEHALGALNPERRAHHRSVEAPIINRLLTRKSLIAKGLEAALHARCKEGSV